MVHKHGWGGLGDPHQLQPVCHCWRSLVQSRFRTAGTCAQVCLQIELDSWLLGMLVDPFELTYDRGSRRLLRFTGVSNLKDGEGQSQQVDIHYRYPEDWEQRDG